LSDYLVVYERADDGGWGAYLPDLPGVVAIGKTRAEVSERIQEALTAYAREIREDGEVLPDAVHQAGTARV